VAAGRLSAVTFDRAAREAFGLDEIDRCGDVAQRLLDVGALADDLARFGEARIATRRIVRGQLIAAFAGDRVEHSYWHLLDDDEYEQVAADDLIERHHEMEAERRATLREPARHDRVVRARATLQIVAATTGGRLRALQPRAHAGAPRTARDRRRRRTSRGRSSGSSRGSPREDDEPDLAGGGVEPEGRT
jgi:hypothetical protein